MNEVYIDITKQNDWIKRHFNKQYVSIDDLLSVIEDLDSEIYDLKLELKELNKTDEEKKEEHLMNLVDEQIDEERLGIR